MYWWNHFPNSSLISLRFQETNEHGCGWKCLWCSSDNQVFWTCLSCYLIQIHRLLKAIVTTSLNDIPPCLFSLLSIALTLGSNINFRIWIQTKITFLVCLASNKCRNLLQKYHHHLLTLLLQTVSLKWLLCLVVYEPFWGPLMFYAKSSSRQVSKSFLRPFVLKINIDPLLYYSTHI